MLSAHGSAPEVVELARREDRVVIDAVCPLVTKVHHELKVRADKGYTVLYVGHHGHEEAVGTMAVAPGSVQLLERAEDVDLLPADEAAGTDPARVALLAQTTLSHDEWAGIVDRARERFPDLWMPNRSDLCFATTNRQAAFKAIADGFGHRRRHRVGELLEHLALEKVARVDRLHTGRSGSTTPPSSRRICTAPWGSPPAPRPPRNSSARSSNVSTRRREQKRFR